MKRIFATAGVRCGRSFEQVVGHRSQSFYRVFPGLLNRFSHSVQTNCQPLPDLNTGGQTKSAAAGATCGRPVYSNENLFFLQHGGLQNLCCLYGALSRLSEQSSPSVWAPSPSTSVTSEWTYGLSPPVTNVTNDSVCLFYMWLEAARPAV